MRRALLLNTASQSVLARAAGLVYLQPFAATYLAPRGAMGG